MHMTSSAGAIAPCANRSIPMGKMPSRVEAITASAKFISLLVPLNHASVKVFKSFIAAVNFS